MGSIGFYMGLRTKITSLIVAVFSASIICFLLNILSIKMLLPIDAYDIWWPFIFSTIYILVVFLSVYTDS